MRFRNIISSLGKDRIVLLSTHIVSDIEYIADRILIMKNGELELRVISEKQPMREAVLLEGSLEDAYLYETQSAEET